MLSYQQKSLTLKPCFAGARTEEKPETISDNYEFTAYVREIANRHFSSRTGWRIGKLPVMTVVCSSSFFFNSLHLACHSADNAVQTSPTFSR